MEKQPECSKSKKVGLRIKIPLVFPFPLLHKKTASTEGVSFSLMFVKVPQRAREKKKLFLVQLCQIETEFLITNTIMQVTLLMERCPSK